MSEPLIRGILYCNYGASGWSEVYCLKETDMGAAAESFKIIAGLRTAFFGDGVQLVWARVATAGGPRDGLMCDLSFPLDAYKGSVGPPAPEDPFTGIMYRFSSSNFGWANRILRGLPDNEIAANDWNGGALKRITGPSVPPLVWPTTATVTNARRGFISRVVGSCCVARRATGNNFDKFDFDFPVVFRKVTRRATGRPFGSSRGRAPAHAGG